MGVGEGVRKGKVGEGEGKGEGLEKGFKIKIL